MLKTKNSTGWGRALSAEVSLARPERISQITAERPAIGNCRSYGDASLNDAGQASIMTRLDRILNFDLETGVLEVEAGICIGELARIFAPQGWLPAVMPGTGFATVGGAITMDVHGKNHHIMGSFGQHVLEITLRQNGGTKTVKPSTALFKATVGGLGQTGVIVSAKLQLLACRGDVMLVTERRMDNWEMFLEALDTSDAPYTVGWIDATAKGAALGRGIIEEGETGPGLVPKAAKSKAVPFNAPHWALSRPIVKLFNAAYFNRVPDMGRTSVKPIQEFFFPLDKIHDWNKLYGKRGFHQFQCVVPIENAPALRDMLEVIAQSGLASPLAVPKRMGDGRAGFMSFPMEGYTLAIDFPNRAAARALIEKLEAMTLAAKGRIYLAKDALGTPEAVQQMYPEHNVWQTQVEKADPDGNLVTDLIRRLNLRKQ